MLIVLLDEEPELRLLESLDSKGDLRKYLWSIDNRDNRRVYENIFALDFSNRDSYARSVADAKAILEDFQGKIAQYPYLKVASSRKTLTCSLSVEGDSQVVDVSYILDREAGWIQNASTSAKQSLTMNGSRLSWIEQTSSALMSMEYDGVNGRFLVSFLSGNSTLRQGTVVSTGKCIVSP